MTRTRPSPVRILAGAALVCTAVVAIGAAAEEMDHHPDIDIRWRHLRLALVTHSAGGRITDLDVALARRIDGIVG